MSGFSFHCFNVGTHTIVEDFGVRGSPLFSKPKLFFFVLVFELLLLPPPKKPPKTESLDKDTLLFDVDTAIRAFLEFDLEASCLVLTTPLNREKVGDFVDVDLGSDEASFVVLGLAPCNENNENVGD